MATWTTGYLEFHEEPDDAPAEPIARPLLRCSECDDAFEDRDALQAHLFHAHPIARPVLRLRGRMCSDATVLISSATDPSNWDVLNCRTATVDGAHVAVEDIGRELSTRSGVVAVHLDSGRAERRYKFDIDIPNTADLEGVDHELAKLLEDADPDVGTISSFIDRCAEFRTAGRYANGIADYLYWRAWRSRNARSGSQPRYEDKLNKSAHILAGFDRPAARAIIGLISFHFNHFDEAAAHALSPRLRGVSLRLATALRSLPVPTTPIAAQLSPAEEALVAPQTRRMIDFCAIPLDGSASIDVDPYESLPDLDSFDRLKVVLVGANHHIANKDPRAGRLIKTAVWHGLPEAWVDTQLDRLSQEGSACANELTFHEVSAESQLILPQPTQPAAFTPTPEPAVAKQDAVADLIEITSTVPTGLAMDQSHEVTATHSDRPTPTDRPDEPRNQTHAEPTTTTPRQRRGIVRFLPWVD